MPQEYIPKVISPLPKEEVDFTAAENLEAEISLLMLSGYSRETAVKYLLEKAKATGQQPVPVVSGGPSPGGRPAVQRAASMSAYQPSATVNRVGSNEDTVAMDYRNTTPIGMQPPNRTASHNSLVPPGYQSPTTRGIQRRATINNVGNVDFSQPLDPRLPPPKSARRIPSDEMSIYSDISASVVGDAPMMNEGSYAAQGGAPFIANPTSYYQEQQYPSYQQSGSSPQRRPPMQSIQQQQQQHPPQQYNHKLSDPALHLSLLISEQEAAFGINMYDSFTPQDQQEKTRLINQGYSEDEALQLIFERKYGPTPPPSAIPPQQLYTPPPQRMSTSSYQTSPTPNTPQQGRVRHWFLKDTLSSRFLH